jgi:tetratricopeptide (TPR) repeat protein
MTTACPTPDRPTRPAPDRRGPTALLLAGALVLAGCASTSGPKEETRADAAPAPAAVVGEATKIDAEVRADFDKALELLRTEQYDQGIELLTRVSQRAPNSSAPLINLAIAQQNLGRLEAAEENLKKALAIAPDHPVASNEYGILYRRTGRFAEARKTYEALLKKEPAFLPARRNLAILCDLYLKDYDCALNNYELYRAASPGDQAVEIWIADVKARAGR